MKAELSQLIPRKRESKYRAFDIRRPGNRIQARSTFLKCLKYAAAIETPVFIMD